MKLISGKVLAGLVKGFPQELAQVEDHIYIPGIESRKDCYAIQVDGVSMEPYIKSGATIILEPVEDRSEFKDGKAYVIIIEGVPLLELLFGHS